MGQTRPRGLASTPASSSKSSSGLNLRVEGEAVLPTVAGFPAGPEALAGLGAWLAADDRLAGESAPGTFMGDLHFGHLTDLPAKSSRTAKFDWQLPQPTLIVIRGSFQKNRGAQRGSDPRSGGGGMIQRWD